uniref:Uncharacterized protein n=1 Tax=Cucumis sativus TaxID=3659 RepID=A0A0A0KVH8_CUCSA
MIWVYEWLKGVGEKLEVIKKKGEESENVRIVVKRLEGFRVQDLGLVYGVYNTLSIIKSTVMGDLRGKEMRVKGREKEGRSANQIFLSHSLYLYSAFCLLYSPSPIPRAGFFSVELSSLENVYGSSTDCTMLKQDCEDFNLPRISRIDTKKYLMASVM